MFPQLYTVRPALGSLTLRDRVTQVPIYVWVGGALALGALAAWGFTRRPRRR